MIRIGVQGVANNNNQLTRVFHATAAKENRAGGRREKVNEKAERNEHSPLSESVTRRGRGVGKVGAKGRQREGVESHENNIYVRHGEGGTVSREFHSRRGRGVGVSSAKTGTEGGEE